MPSPRPHIPCSLVILAGAWLALCPSLPAAEAGGVSFDIPTAWKATPKPMRAANYTIPAAPGDTGDGELAVFYFGPGQGGGVDANVRRWLGQFVQADGSPMKPESADRSEQQVNGMRVTVLDVSGTYLFKPFPMAPRATPMPGYRMLAAIVQGPDAPVFFKLTAPAGTAAAAAAQFRQVLASLRR